MKTVWYRFIGENIAFATVENDVVVYLKYAIKEQSPTIMKDIEFHRLNIFASIDDYGNDRSIDSAVAIPNSTMANPLIVSLPSSLSLPSDDEVTTAILRPENKRIPLEYKEVALIYKKNRQSAEEVIQQIEEMQSKDFGDSPMKTVWYRIIGDDDDKCVHLTDDYLFVSELMAAVKTEEKHRVPENVGTEMIQVFASIAEYKNKNPFGGRDAIPSDTYDKPLRILLPSRLPLPSDDEVTTALLKPENESIPLEYKEVAQIYKNNRQSAEEVIQQIERMKCRPKFGKSPSPFVCIFDSSGTGKTQFAVTTAYLRETAKVVYLYTGKLDNDNAQRVYTPHMALWGRLSRLIADYGLNLSNGKAGQVGAQTMLNDKNKHPLISAFNKILFDDYTPISISELRKSVDLLEKKIFVFLDEVPREGNNSANFNAIALRNFLRAIGIVPVLMSTHSGSHNAILSNADSRGETKTRTPWCLVITKLPARVTATEGYLYQTERPLVERIISTLPTGQQDSLASCVFAVRDHLLPAKKNAWRTTPIFQLCQLFQSTKDPNDRHLCSHRLVGEHFGHFELKNKEEDTILYTSCTKLQGRIRMPEAEREPILFLALTAWRTAELEEGKFPLQDSGGKALSVRQAFDMCQDDFSPDVYFKNPKAMKNDENLMEVLALASMTLASLCSDQGLLSGVLLPDFVAMVYCFMLRTEPNDSLGSRLEHWRESLRRFFDDEKNKDVPHGKMKVPPVPACDSEFPNLNTSFERGSLVRPRDADKRYGILSSLTSGAIVQVECRNYREGLDTDTLERVIERMKVNGKVTFLFTSKLNYIWQDGADLDTFMADHNLENGKMCILHLQEGKAPSWAATPTGVVLAPSNEYQYFLVVMSVA